MIVRFVAGISFFFQAEDGIRDHCVTGVQTCALPILGTGRTFGEAYAKAQAGSGTSLPRKGTARSEERRVGKECRSWRSAAHNKKKSEPSIMQSSRQADYSGTHRW